MTPEDIIHAYSAGYFPWPEHPDQPTHWYNPDPRFVLLFENFHISQSLKKALHANLYEIRVDTCFSEVMKHCANSPRPGQAGTWITPEIINAYSGVHKLGLAHSIEAFKDNKLVGGLYGVSLGGVFFGESMFALEPNASKIAFVKLVEQLQKWDFDFIDCQAYTEHLARFGATFWPRDVFLKALAKSLQKPTHQGLWRFES